MRIEIDHHDAEVVRRVLIGHTKQLRHWMGLRHTTEAEKTLWLDEIHACDRVIDAIERPRVEISSRNF